MRWNREAVLVIDDDWLAADEIRVMIKSAGIINVPIAMSANLIALAREHFSVIFIVMPERIKRSPTHPLRLATLKHFPTTPLIAFHEHVRQELLLPLISKELNVHIGNKKQT